LNPLDRLVRAWHRAAEDLGISVVAPYQVADQQSQTAVDSVAWVESFGSARGAVVVGRHYPREPIKSIAKAHGQFCSFIDEESYAEYDRDLFVATLNDWGWYGDPDETPEWYTGESWTN
jgi:hypothetical protein